MPTTSLPPVAARPDAAAGFTLIELIVTIAIAAILLTLAAPSFVAFQRNSQLSTTVNAFVAALGAARAEAMKLQRNVVLEPVGGGTDWTRGWNVCVDADWNGTCGSNAPVLTQAAVPSTVTVVPGRDGTGGYVLFNGAGFLQSRTTGQINGGLVYLQLTNGPESRNVLVSASGRVQTCKPDPATCRIDTGW